MRTRTTLEVLSSVWVKAEMSLASWICSASGYASPEAVREIASFTKSWLKIRSVSRRHSCIRLAMEAAVKCASWARASIAWVEMVR